MQRYRKCEKERRNLTKRNRRDHLDGGNASLSVSRVDVTVSASPGGGEEKMGE